MYRKEIIYIGLYKDGSRIGNAGFLKVENREPESRWDLKLKNIPFNIRGRFPIRIHNGKEWKEINGISVQEGGGNWEESMTDSAQGVQIQIVLPGGYFLEGKSKNVPETAPQLNRNTAKRETIIERKDGAADDRRNVQKTESEQVRLDMPDMGRSNTQENRADKSLQNVQDDITEEASHNVQDGTTVMTAYSMQNDTEPDRLCDMHKTDRLQGVRKTESIIRPYGAQENKPTDQPCAVEEMTASIMPKEQDSQNNPMPGYLSGYSLREDKWEQILDSYEQIHPYGDERVYVRLEPKDFIILQSKYQHLVNNSFLLHGFYNYRYVILGKEDDYYLGVPGVFYEREKMVALMFGFEAFECPGGIARAGEFGYYLRKVEL